ncbi:MAG: hypothetical protein FJZ47_13645 [Candidatus Tectomicrobia bacterium]|uniref:Zorya protein ZorC EH domain-containing protein n=1 Tax=Tectimicrobiota bacterium TaxID=2528274 RepID=A0A938B1D7_UNCTE|nr:hypothetical protein [Candidatus Tectomicrobia bacterium]
MEAAETGVTLQQALRGLHQVGQALRREAQQPLTAAFPLLQNVLATLMAQAAVRPRHYPAAYVLAWEYYLVDPQQPLTTRMVRYLCWEPSVATDMRFQTYLDTVMGTLSSRVLQGLLWCCHMDWTPAFAAGEVVQCVQQRLAAYQGEDGMLTRWRQHAEILLSPAGPQSLATALAADRLSIAALCHAWAIDERSPYVLAVLRHALGQCLQAMGDAPALRTYLLSTLLPWGGWTVRDFRKAIAATVLHPVTASTDGMPAQLCTLVLGDTRLGDPRLPSQQPNWQAISQDAQQQCVHWLSSADITFFFDHVLSESKDQQERQMFWLLYAPRVVRSRPLLQGEDLERLQPLLRQMPEMVVHFGHMQGEASALILDFGAVVVVQTNDLSDACYVYGKRNFAQLVPEFWQEAPFTMPELLVSREAATIYYHQTWESDLAEILALCDIQPTYKAPTDASAIAMQQGLSQDREKSIVLKNP